MSKRGRKPLHQTYSDTIIDIALLLNKSKGKDHLQLVDINERYFPGQNGKTLQRTGRLAGIARRTLMKNFGILSAPVWSSCGYCPNCKQKIWEKTDSKCPNCTTLLKRKSATIYCNITDNEDACQRDFMRHRNTAEGHYRWISESKSAWFDLCGPGTPLLVNPKEIPATHEVYQLGSPMVKCPSCGKDTYDMPLCGYCGAKLH